MCRDNYQILAQAKSLFAPGHREYSTKVSFEQGSRILYQHQRSNAPTDPGPGWSLPPAGGFEAEAEVEVKAGVEAKARAEVKAELRAESPP